MDYSVENFLLTYPNFKQNSDQKYDFEGNLKIKGCFYHIRLSLPEFPSIKNFQCKIQKGLQFYTLRCEDVDKNWSISELLVNFPDLIQEPIETEDLLTATATAVKQFLLQLLSIDRKECKIFLCKSYKYVKFADFPEYPKHFLELEISKSFSPKIKQHSLPECDDIMGDLFPPLSSLDAYFKQFKKLLEDFCDFYTNMNALDELCYVVEPVPVTTKHNWRIFKLNDKVLIKVTANPFSPSSTSVRLIGPTYEIEKYRTTYNEKISQWDTESDIYTNLLRIFELMYFPMKDNDDEDDLGRYCNICYTYRLDGRVPTIRCDNPCCDLIFHVPCLKEWFNMNGKTVFAVTLGTCPSCKEKLSASFADLLEI